MARVKVLKTYKLFLGGEFPRTESGRSIAVEDRRGMVCAHICRASKKDLRDAVEAARAVQEKWAGRTAYNRSQILYRMAEMLEGRAAEFAQTIRDTTDATLAAARKEVEASIDRLVCFSGWADKFAQILGCQNPVAGPYYNFTVPEATGVVGLIAPEGPSLLGLVTLLAPPICAGCTVVTLASEAYPLPAVLLGEVCATSDLPGGVLNILTGYRRELLDHLARHRNVDAISAANVSDEEATTLRRGAAENVKRVRIDQFDDGGWYDVEVCHSPWTIEPFVEMKTIWHPSAT